MNKKIFLLAICLLAFFLRFYRLGENPPSLYWDEASLGYNAYAISQTLRDEHGEFLPLARFIAFGDYKPPGYIYADALAVKIFGLSEFSVRFPSAAAGVLLVLLTYFLTGEFILIKDKKGENNLIKALNIAPLTSSFIVAVSPWAVSFSRGAFEANLATLFSGSGVLFFLYGLRSGKAASYLASAAGFILAMYTFNSHRVFVPLLVATLLLIFFRELWQRKTGLLLFLLACLLFSLPLLSYLRSRESRLRFNEVAWVNDLAPIETINKRVELDGNSWWSKIIHNRRILYTREFLKHYTDHFKPDFLFLNGDINPRLSSRGTGELYWIELPLLILGLWYLLNKRNKFTAMVFSWLLLAPIPAALARETPHALRILNILPIPQIIIALGIYQLRTWEKLTALFSRRGKWLTIIFISALYFGSLVFYLKDYWEVYPEKYASFWQYGYKQAVQETKELEVNFPCVSVTQVYGRPYIYFLLYNKYPPQDYWKTRVADRDWYGFWYVHRFDKYYFDENPALSGCLRVGTPEEIRGPAKILKEIKDPGGETVFTIYEKI